VKIRPRTIARAAGAALVLLLAVGILAPYISADQYGQRLRGALERALGRRVEFRGKVRFSLFKGPGFSVENVVIHEDPSIGLEPMAYMDALEVRPALWSLLGGRFVIASIRLDGAHINLAKSGPAAAPGRWNFASFVNRTVLSSTPAIHVRDGRINIRFGDTKSVFYLTGTDLDITPPGPGGAGWSVACSAQPARTDRPAQGLGSFTLQGRWYIDPERVDLDLTLDRSGLGEITALLRGQSGAVHGTVSARLHLGGPIGNIGAAGRLTIEDVHRWDLLPPQGQGWPVDIRGRLDLVHDQLELESSQPGDTPLPLWVRLRVNDYLSQPHWAVTANWNRFPVGPLLDLARHMGAQLPPRLQLGGSMDGAIGYSGHGSLQGELAFHDAAVAIPDSPPVRFEQAHIVFDHGHVRLAPALVRTASEDRAQLEADYSMEEGTLGLSIATDAMKVASLRAQVALAAVPWLEQVRSGEWSGRLDYHSGPAGTGWTGSLRLTDSQVAIPGLADPINIASARAKIDGARVALDQIDATAGKIAFTGSYGYEPGAARPHRVRLRLGEADAADLEAELMPTLRRTTGLIARALGRSTVPAWLRQRAVDGTVQIDALILAGVRLQNFRARLLWDVARAELDSVQARIDRASVTGSLAVNLRGPRPVYRFTGKLKGLSWQSGRLDAEGTVESSGTGSQLRARLTSEGTFSGAALDFGAPGPLRSFAGGYHVAWSQPVPRWRLTNLTLRTDDDTYTGRGTTQDDGRIVILLSSGTKEMRMTGTPENLKVEEP
jgi:hypothetical protein